jgi:AraC family transcriptional activator of mtrCDE
VVSHLSGALFALAMRAAAEQEQSFKGLLALAGKPRLQPAVAAMFDTPERAWSLPDLASLCHMSRATFARHFDEALGRSASDVLTEIRMTKAGRMLASTDMPVGAVAYAVGYHSEAAFQRVFKRHVGVTPSRWRASAAAGEVPSA